MSLIGESLFHVQFLFLSSFYMSREDNRQTEIKQLTSQGIVPYNQDLEKHPEKSLEARSWLMGRVVALINVSDLFGFRTSLS